MDWLSNHIIELSILTRDQLPNISLALVVFVLSCKGKCFFSIVLRWLHYLPAILCFPIKTTLGLTIAWAVVYYLPKELTNLFDLFNNMTLFPIVMITLFLSGFLLYSRHPKI